MRHRWPLLSDEVKEFIFDNYKGNSSVTMTKLINSEFGENTANESQIKYFYKNHKLSSGLSGQFKKGHISWNKNKPRSEWNLDLEAMQRINKNLYEKGHIPYTSLPLGTERWKQGFIYVKVEEPNLWKRKHVILWEKENGPVPPHHCVIFLDGDRTNFSLDNIACVSRREALKLNEKGWHFKDIELQKTALNLVRLKIKMEDIINEKQSNEFE